jgi:large subunit ribosomal protein L32e
MAIKFLRREYNRYSRLSRKKKLKWKRPNGRDNKMREKRKGYAPVVSIGYKRKAEERATPVVVTNLIQLEKFSKGDKIVVGKMGIKKKIQFAERANEKGVELQNLNIKRFLKENKQEKKA